MHAIDPYFILNFKYSINIYIYIYGIDHAEVYKITCGAFEYSNKTSKLSLSSQAFLAHCGSAVPHE